MKAHIRKWGNSLALRIPRALAAEARIEQGSEVELSLNDRSLTIEVVQPSEISLGTLLAEVTEENLYTEVETGDSVGREVW